MVVAVLGTATVWMVPATGVPSAVVVRLCAVRPLSPLKPKVPVAPLDTLRMVTVADAEFVNTHCSDLPSCALVAGMV